MSNLIGQPVTVSEFRWNKDKKSYDKIGVVRLATFQGFGVTWIESENGFGVESSAIVLYEDGTLGNVGFGEIEFSK